MFCYYCSTEKEESLFYRKTGKKFMCKSCNSKRMVAYLNRTPEERVRQRERSKQSKPTRRKIRRQFVDWLKTAPCTDCGVAYPPYVMDFDHLTPKRSRQHAVGEMINRCLDEATLFDEILKCELVCANCHRSRTHKRTYNHK